MGEAFSQRPAAGLAVGVLELDALEHGRRLARGSCSTRGDARLERAGQRDDLEHRAGRLRRRVGDPGQREHLAVARPHAPRRRRSGRPAPRPRRAGRRGRSSCAPRCRARGATRGEHALARAQLAARRARPARRRTRARARSAPTGAPGGTPRRSSSAARSGGAGPTRPAISDGERAELGEPRLALGQRRAVARLDRGARRHRRRRARASRPAQAGVDEAAAPVDAAPSSLLDDGQLERAARARRRCACAGGPARRPRRPRGSAATAAVDARERGDVGGLAVGADEAAQRDRALRLGREQAVHRRVVAARPRVARTPARRARAGPRRRGADDHAGGERGTPAATSRGARRVHTTGAGGGALARREERRAGRVGVDISSGNLDVVRADVSGSSREAPETRRASGGRYARST